MLLLKKKSLHGYQHWLVPDIFESSFSQLARMSESVRGFNERRDGEFYTATYCSDLTFANKSQFADIRFPRDHNLRGLLRYGDYPLDLILGKYA